MNNKAVEFILAKMPEIQKEAVAKIKQLALSGLKSGEAKKAELDKHIIDFIDKSIDVYDIPVIPDFVVDPALKKLVAKYIPEITQQVFNTLEDKLD